MFSVRLCCNDHLEMACTIFSSQNSRFTDYNFIECSEAYCLMRCLCVSRDTDSNINVEAHLFARGREILVFFSYFHFAVSQGDPACKLQSACAHGLSVQKRQRACAPRASACAE